MKNASDFAKKFKSFKKKLPAPREHRYPEAQEHIIGEIIYSHLIWNATQKQASEAFKKLMRASVDMNDLRVNMIDETIQLIGGNYPYARERSRRLHAVLNAIYNREHGMQITSLEGAGKREIREYFETLNGITPFVCHRVILICYNVAAIPVDEQTLDILIDQSVVHPNSSIGQVASWLARQVKAEESINFHGSLQSWIEVQPKPKKNSETQVAAKKPKVLAKKKVTKKKVTKKKVAKKKVAKKKVAKKKVTKKKVAKKKVAKKKVTKKKVTKKKVAKK